MSSSSELVTIQALYNNKDFNALSKAFELFVSKPSLNEWRRWFDTFSSFDGLWFEQFFQYHQDTPSNGSRGIMLLLTYTQLMHLQGEEDLMWSTRQKTAVQNIMLSTHGLFVVLPTTWTSCTHVMQTLLHLGQGQMFTEDWITLVEAEITPEWRVIFYWTLLYCGLEINPNPEWLYKTLNRCNEDERRVLVPFVHTWMIPYIDDSTINSGFINAKTEVSSPALLGLYEAQYLFEQDNIDKALALLDSAYGELVNDIVDKQWHVKTLNLMVKHHLDTDLFYAIVQSGITLGLPSALHLALENIEDSQLRVQGLSMNHARHYWPSTMALVDFWWSVPLTQDQVWPLVDLAAKYHYAPALFWLGLHDNRGRELTCMSEALAHEYSPAAYFAAVKILKGEWTWSTNTQQLSLNSENGNIDISVVFAFLDVARDDHIYEASVLWLSLLSEDTAVEFYLTLCAEACEIDPEYARNGYIRAVKDGNLQRVLEWTERMLVIATSEDLPRVYTNQWLALSYSGQSERAATLKSQYDALLKQTSGSDTLPLLKASSPSISFWQKAKTWLSIT